jgi:hypothetical protein
MMKQTTCLTSDQIKKVEEFVQYELSGRTPKYVHEIFNKMFRKVKNDTLRQKYLANAAISRAGQSSFEFMCRLV